MKYTKEEARRKVLNCAKQYQDKLLNKKLIIIYREREDNQIYYIEVAFYARNYQHLTGLELTDADGNVLYHQAENFYRKCIENKLGINEIRFKTDGTTHLKLSALDSLTDVSKITKITGDYNGTRPYLYVDKIMFIKENNNFFHMHPTHNTQYSCIDCKKSVQGYFYARIYRRKSGRDR